MFSSLDPVWHISKATQLRPRLQPEFQRKKRARTLGLDRCLHQGGTIMSIPLPGRWSESLWLLAHRWRRTSYPWFGRCRWCQARWFQVRNWSSLARCQQRTQYDRASQLFTHHEFSYRESCTHRRQFQWSWTRWSSSESSFSCIIAENSDHCQPIFQQAILQRQRKHCLSSNSMLMLFCSSLALRLSISPSRLRRLCLGSASCRRITGTDLWRRMWWNTVWVLPWLKVRRRILRHWSIPIQWFWKFWLPWCTDLTFLKQQMLDLLLSYSVIVWFPILQQYLSNQTANQQRWAELWLQQQRMELRRSSKLPAETRSLLRPLMRLIGLSCQGHLPDPTTREQRSQLSRVLNWGFDSWIAQLLSESKAN